MPGNDSALAEPAPVEVFPLHSDDKQDGARKGNGSKSEPSGASPVNATTPTYVQPSSLPGSAEKERPPERERDLGTPGFHGIEIGGTTFPHGPAPESTPLSRCPTQTTRGWFTQLEKQENLAQQMFLMSALGGAAVEVANVATGRQRRTLAEQGTLYRPLLFCSWMAAKPRTMCCAVCGMWCVTVLLTPLLIALGVSVFPLVFDQVPLNLVNSDAYLRYQGWLHAKLEVDYTAKYGSVPPRIAPGTYVYTIYKHSGGNALNRETLKSIQKLERELVSVEGYDQWCLVLALGAQPWLNCRPPVSIVSLFDGSIAQYHPAAKHIQPDPEFSDIEGTMALWGEADPDLVDSLVGREYTNTSYRSAVLRSVLAFGLPVSAQGNYTDPDQDRDEQITIVDDWIASVMTDMLESASVTGCRTLYFNQGIATKATVAQVQRDLMLALGSLFFIWCFVWAQTKSLLVTAGGIGGVLIAFFASNLFYRFVLDYRFFGIFHVLSIFIILGIGADDVFVFYDAWMQSRAESFNISGSLENRLSWTYRRSISAIVITSATTMASFLSAANTELLAMHTFGLYSALLVLFNFFVVCTLFPCVIAVWDRHYVYRPVGCLRCAGTTTSTVLDPESGDPVCPASLGMLEARASDASQNGGATDLVPLAGGQDGKDEAVWSQSDDVEDQLDPETLESPIDKFCRLYWSKIVTHRQGRFVILLAFAGLVSVFIFGASQLEVDKEAVKIWKPGTNWEDFKVVNAKEMKPSKESDRIQVVVVWGLKNQDRSMCDGPTDFLCVGQVVFDESYDLNPVPAQLELLEFCRRLAALKDDPVMLEKLAIKLDRDGNVDMNCFISYMHGKFNDSFPVTRFSLGQFDPLLLEVSPYNRTTYYRWFELGLGMLAGIVTPNVDFGASTLAEFQQTYMPLLGAVDEPLYGAQLRYGAVTVDTTLLYPVAFSDGLPVNDAWESFIAETRAEIAPPLRSMFHIGRKWGRPTDGKQVSDNSFHWLMVQENLVRTAFSGIILGLSLALVVLVAATGNIIVGVLSTATIVMIVIMVLGFIYFAGWKIGVLESLNLTLVVGLSVDYVVHLAHAYTEASEESRVGKMSQALHHVGGSVLSGALTTLGSSLFMLFAKILFFFQFGLIVFATIGFSCTYALVLFPALMSTIGPQGPRGRLPLTINYKRMKKQLWEFFNRRGRRGHTVDCEVCFGWGYRFVDTDEQRRPEAIRKRHAALGEAARLGALTRDEYNHAVNRLQSGAGELIHPSMLPRLSFPDLRRRKPKRGQSFMQFSGSRLASPSSPAYPVDSQSPVATITSGTPNPLTRPNTREAQQ